MVSQIKAKKLYSSSTNKYFSLLVFPVCSHFLVYHHADSVHVTNGSLPRLFGNCTLQASIIHLVSTVLFSHHVCLKFEYFTKQGSKVGSHS